MKKVLVAMSGGVDSSVAAALLVKQGFEVTGAFMKQWSDTRDISGVCSWKVDRRDALRVAAKLNIKLITLDFEKEYKNWVMEYMFREYELGRTPNPDVLCNKYIKFGVWLNRARELGFDYLATGHYAQIKKARKQESKKARNLSDLTYQLVSAKDKDKDQTYFLHQLNQEQLAQTLFPIGEYTKAEVRGLAEKFDLPTASREESMGICFVGEVPMKDFLQQKIKVKKGEIISTAGELLGEHDGLPFYTIGQRNLGVQGIKNSEQGTSPLYVVGKNFTQNQLVVGFEDDPALYCSVAKVEEIHWISGQAPKFPLKCEVRLRHRQILQGVVIKDQRLIEFDNKQRAVTPGQFAVFYKGQECLGGGVVI